MEEYTPMQQADTVPQDQPDGSAAPDGVHAEHAAQQAKPDQSAATAAAGPAEEAGHVPDTTPEAGTASAAQTITIPVQFNHVSRELTLEEAQSLAQKGLKFDELTPTLDKLRYLAAANGKSLNEMADALVKSQDRQLYESLLAECGGSKPIAKRLFEAEKRRHTADFEAGRRAEAAAAQEEKAALTQRLADEFIELQREFPELTAFSAVPKTVLQTALKGVTLTDAYLRYRHAEDLKASAARVAQEAAAKSSAGPQSAGGGETIDPTIDAMLAGLWEK